MEKSFLDEITQEWQKFRQSNNNLPDEWVISTGRSIMMNHKKAKILKIT